MKKILTAVVMMAALAVSAVAQHDWYHDRDDRYRGDAWRQKVFMQVRTDLEHVYSVNHAADRERRRIETTKGELTKIQGDLDQGRWDNGIVNDVIDSLRKSSNDDRLAPRDRAVLADDVTRIKQFQDQRNHPPR